MANSPFRLAIVGTGGSAAAHASDIHRFQGRASIIAAVDIEEGRLESFADRWSVRKQYTDLSSMLDIERPDLVHLCTPPHLHHNQALACLNQGINVLCEKPPVLSLSDLDDIDEAQKQGGWFGAVFHHRFGSGVVRLRAFSQDPRCGRPLAVLCHTLWYRPDEYFAVPWRGHWSTGCGPTLSHGIHHIDLMLTILGQWREVVALVTRQVRSTQTEDLSCALVTFESGAVATVVNSLLSPRETSYLRFDFEYATVELDHLYGYADDDWTVTPAPGHVDDVSAAWAEGPRGRPSSHYAQFEAVFDSLRRGGPIPVAVADVRPTLELITAIYASAGTRRPIRRGDLTRDSQFYQRMGCLGHL